jgi:hypothetical protein
MSNFTKETRVRLKDAGSTSWPELHGRIGVVKEVTHEGTRVRVFFDDIGWLDFAPEQLELAPPPKAPR